ncbi:MAG TPA: DUF805 domain-containing protein [Rhizomicrobium sp.]|jgi:uncharacterized membrane protein YhaH (DUF805 family)
MDGIDINKLWQNFLDTITNHYIDFNGRVGRAQFWYYVLVVAVLAVGVGIVASVTTHFLSSLFALALLLPNLGMGARRLHDIGQPTMLVFLPLIPTVLAYVFFFMFLWPLAALCWLATLAAAIYLIYLYIQPGNEGSNAFGPPPAPWSPGK